MEADIQKRIDDWTKPPFNKETIDEIKELIKQENDKDLKDRFYTNLEFGTGGLRGIMGAGTNRINIYTVGMATQGLANYIRNKNKSDKGVVIACDSRNRSNEFAVEAASILAGNGIKVYLFEDITPTPICSFAIRHLGTASGIVITASHNPPEYNGYKVYWEDGGQVISPVDEEIIEEVKKIESISSIDKTDYNSAVKQGLIKIVGKDVIDVYTGKLEQTALRKKSDSDIKIVYSPLHGTGYKIIPELLNHFGFRNVSIVSEQARPDGNFPTVKYPNPEEKDAMQLGLDLAAELDADILMATDPDADRMGVGFKDNKGNYILINGNQIGTMLEYYLLSRMKEENKLPANAAIVKTIVTTELQREIAESFDCKIEDVLTGFKWIADKMKSYDNSGSNKFVFGGEESYGYLPVDFVRDKDAVSACYFFAEMADYLASRGTTLYEFLNRIYINYKLYLEDLHSLTLKGIDGMEQIKKIMSEFRKNPPAEFSGVDIIRIADINSLTAKDTKSGAESPVKDLPKSNVLQFFLSDGSKITMRPSGTEPKIKFYFSVNEKVNSGNIEEKTKELKEKIAHFKEDLVKKLDRI
ncbi:MAG: phospho-sugar mutase [Spirochaetes bacterium]|nr:phospho-sugar mutase [Spirochaetota bacterium]